MTGDLPTRSPWLEQLRTDLPPQNLQHDLATDVVVVGGGIAGAATVFFLVHDTDRRCCSSSVGAPATGPRGTTQGNSPPTSNGHCTNWSMNMVSISPSTPSAVWTARGISSIT